MQSIAHIENQISAGRRWLVATTRQAFLCNDAPSFVTTGEFGAVQFLITDLAVVYASFCAAIPDEMTEITTSTVSALAATTPKTMHEWIQAGTIRPSVRLSETRGREHGHRWSAAGAFGVALVAALQRRRIPAPVLARVFRFAATGDFSADNETPATK